MTRMLKIKISETLMYDYFCVLLSINESQYMNTYLHYSSSQRIKERRNCSLKFYLNKKK